jgi:hypothetical protein
MATQLVQYGVQSQLAKVNRNQTGYPAQLDALTSLASALAGDAALVAHVAGKPRLLVVDAGCKLIAQDVKPAFKQLEIWGNRYENERGAA